MKFENFVRRGLVKKKKVDLNLAIALKKTSEIDLEFLNGVDVNKISARKVVSGYYDVLRMILEGIGAMKGYKIYSHEAFAYFLGEIGENSMFDKFDRFRLIRNKINYYGKNVSCDEALEYKTDITGMIKYFMERLKNEIKK